MADSPGTRRGRLSAAKQVERNRAVYEARVAGESWASIATRFQISERHAYRAAAEHEAAARLTSRRLRDLDPDALVAGLIDAQARALALAASLAVSADSDSARVGALRTVTTIATSLHTALLRSGLAGDPGITRFAAELEIATQAMFRLAERHGVPVDAVLEAIDGLPGRGQLEAA